MFTFRLTLYLLSFVSIWTLLFACQNKTVYGMGIDGGVRVQAGCQIVNLPAKAQDSLALLLKEQLLCPENVHDFRALLKAKGAQLQTTLVANRGYHNPKAGSFSLFEMVRGTLRLQQKQLRLLPGTFFFGHFTEAEGLQLRHQDTPAKGALMIELISWDPQAELFLFYEMIGNGQKGQWFYRGDSLDIRKDLATLHLQPNPKSPVFGNRLRCSACHLAGGPIMKELDFPHNDWWMRNRPLPFAHEPNTKIKENLNSLEDATHLAQAVKVGMGRLSKSKSFQRYQASRPLAEQLRPLFCAEEINLSSDTQFLGQSQLTHLPSSVFVDPRILPVTQLVIERKDYQRALEQLGAQFPENQKRDADHAWLAPVKAKSDIQAIDRFVKQGLIDKETVADVLAIDMLRPVISPIRCQLLHTLPRHSGVNWKINWKRNLSKSPLPAAKELLTNLNDPRRNLSYYQQQAKAFFQACGQESEAVQILLNWVGQQRQAVFSSELAKHPRGQIFEPGFRVIFPVLERLTQKTLTRDCTEK